jgi:hypothetical protein
MGNTKKARSHESYNEISEIPKHIQCEQSKRVSEFAKQQRHYLMTTRFSEETWEENGYFRNKHKHIGCVYGSTMMSCSSIPIDTVMFVLEMNNSENKIMGIGLVKNHPIFGKYDVYDNNNVNRYLFMGKIRIDRTEMTPVENEIMKFFDIICFRGWRHMKRGNGLTRFPVHILYQCMKVFDLVNFISNMFKKRMSKQ